MVYFAIIIYVIYFLVLPEECFVPELFCTLVLLLSFKFSLLAQSGREHFDLRSQASSASWEIMDSADNTVLTVMYKVLTRLLPHCLQRKTDGFPEGREFVGGKDISKENFEVLVSLEKFSALFIHRNCTMLINFSSKIDLIETNPPWEERSLLWDLKILQASFLPSQNLFLRKSGLLYRLGRNSMEVYTKLVLVRLQYMNGDKWQFYWTVRSS